MKELAAVVVALGGAALTIYAVRSYGYQKEVNGYMKAVKVMVEEAEKHDGKILK